MIIRTFFRVLWAVTAFVLAVMVALAALFALGALWVGDELRAAAPGDPVLEMGGPWFGVALFTTTVAPALTIFPALIAVVVGEVLRIRSWMYYVLAGGAALAAIPVLASAPAGPMPGLPAGQYMTIFAAAGFAGGFVYWLLAGRGA
ncbi:MAG: hypothetical protein WA441_05765 [Methyloceanibacter sp.]